MLSLQGITRLSSFAHPKHPLSTLRCSQALTDLTIGAVTLELFHKAPHGAWVGFALGSDHFNFCILRLYTYKIAQGEEKTLTRFHGKSPYKQCQLTKL